MKRVRKIMLLLVICALLTGCGQKTEEPVLGNKDEVVETELLDTPEITEPEVLTFVEEHNLMLEKVTPDDCNSWCIIGFYRDRDAIYCKAIDPEGAIDRNMNVSTNQFVGGPFSIAKWYGEEGLELQNYETIVYGWMSEVYLSCIDDYEEIAKMCIEISDEEYNGSEYQAKIKEEAYRLHEKYPGHKMISCQVRYDWGAVDRMDLFEETGTIYGDLEHAILFKYTGEAFSFDDNTVVDESIEWNGKTHDIMLICSGEASYQNEMLHTDFAISALVPADYDGAVWAIGNGSFDPDEEVTDETIHYHNFEESPLYKDPSVRYYAYTPTRASDFYSENYVKTVEEIYKQVAPLTDVRALNEDYYYFYEMDGLRGSNDNIYLVETADGLYITSYESNYHPISIVLLDENYNIAGQTGLLAPGQILENIDLAKDFHDNPHSYAVVYYNDDGSVALVKEVKIHEIVTGEDGSDNWVLWEPAKDNT